MRRFILRLAAVTLGAPLMILGGCASTQPSKFYLLTSLPDAGTSKPVAAAERGVAIGIGPIELPPYLDRPQIVTRASENQLDLSEFNRWAEPLRDNVARVLAENLSILLSTDRAAAFPWQGSTPIDYQVTVEVIRFEGNAAGQTSLIARWSLFGTGGKEVLLTRKSDHSVPAAGRDYEAMVSAMSRALADFSREIAAAIKEVSPQTSRR